MMKTSTPTVLVLLRSRGGRYVYTRYRGRELTHEFEAYGALSQYWVEEIRNDPGQVEATIKEAPIATEPPKDAA